MTKLSEHTPIVNRNGNTCESLVMSVQDVLNALETVKNAMRLSDLTHGRNFQVNPAEDQDLFNQAWRNHLETLEDISKDVLDVGLNLNRQ